MKLFYFHLRTGNETVIDDEGTPLPDYSSACIQAEQSVRELLANAIKFAKYKIPDAVVIADKEGAEIGSVSFGAVLLSAMRQGAGPFDRCS